jgi:hypothetical protein
LLGGEPYHRPSPRDDLLVEALYSYREYLDLLGHLQKRSLGLNWKTLILAPAQDCNKLGNAGHAGRGDDSELGHVSAHGVCRLASLTHE